MTRIRRTFVAVAITVALVAGGAAAKEKSLYERLGGYDAVAAVTDDFLGRLIADKEFHAFFVGASVDTQKRIRQHIVDFFCQATGGPCYYVGRDMKTVHAGLGITEEQWKRSLGLFGETMKKLNVGEQEQKDLAVALGPLEKDIVEKK
jgi:hemoglobin